MKLQNKTASIEMDAIAKPAFPEYRRLWAAVLIQAIADVDSPGRVEGMTASKVRLDAWQWLNSDNNGPTSCKWICEILDIDHEMLVFSCNTREGRRHIREAQRNKKKKKSEVAA
jgi:hypothetical protein